MFKKPSSLLEIISHHTQLYLVSMSLITSFSALISSSHILSEVALKFMLMLITVVALRNALLGVNHWRYLLIILTMPLFTIFSHYVVSPGIEITDVVTLIIMSTLLGLYLPIENQSTNTLLYGILTQFSACFTISSAKTLALELRGAYGIILSVIISLMMLVIGLTTPNVLEKPLKNVLILLESSIPSINKLSVPRSHLLKLDRLRDSKRSLALRILPRTTNKLATQSVIATYRACLWIISKSAYLEENIIRVVMKVSRAIEIAERRVEISLTYSLLLIGLLTTLALIVYAILTAITR